MNPILAGVAVLVVAAAILAVSAREPRVVVLSLAVGLVAAPVLAEPMAAPLGLAARLGGSILAVYQLWIALRDRRDRPPGPSRTEGSRIGWPAEVLVAASASVVGWAAHGLGAPPGGPALASVAGFAVAALAVAPLFAGRDVLRVGVGVVLLLDGGLLVRVALGGTPDPLEQLVTAGLLVAVGGTLAALARAARADGDGDLDLHADPDGPRARRRPDWPPMAAAPPLEPR